MEITNRDDEKIQPAVKMDKKLFTFLTDWIKTDEAKSLGFHSKSHLVTQAVRDLMFKYRTEKFKCISRTEDGYSMQDMFLNKVVKVEIDKREHALDCEYHYPNGFKCDHVYAIWHQSEFINELLELRLLNPFGPGFNSPATAILNKK